jgi:protein TonB
MPLTFLDLDRTDARVEAVSAVAARRGVTVAGAVVFHAALIGAAALLPLLSQQESPEPAGVHAFVTLPDLAPPPPPPPPAPARATAPVRRTPEHTHAMAAPTEIPDQAPEQAEADFSGLEGGVPGGVEGGVEGGVVGGVVGGLGEEPPDEPQVVRVGGQIQEPRILRDVAPVYPPLALAAHATGLVILELQVGRDGRVKQVEVLRGIPMFADAAADAVRQRVYQPLLLSGIPIDFVVTVTVRFNVKIPGPRRGA